MTGGLANRFLAFAIASAFVLQSVGCDGVAGNSKYFGRTTPPSDNVLHYVSGSEPETLDPQVSSGQPEARIYMALYEGLVENGPKDLQPIPAIAKSWEISPGVDEFVFHLREDAKLSDGTPITAEDFVYTFRRAFSPALVSTISELGFFVMNAEAAKTAQVFVKKNGEFLLEKDFGGDAKMGSSVGPETDFHTRMHAPRRLTLPGDLKKRTAILEKNPSLNAAADGAEFVPVKGEDVGAEAIDPYTFRVTLRQSAPFFLGLLAHQLFRVVPRHVIEARGDRWIDAANIVTSGAFKVKASRPYDALVVDRNPFYWDAKNVGLDGIEFYPLEDNSTILNLYKAGTVHGFLNHAVISSWIDDIRVYKDEYMNLPEGSTAYYSMNVTKPPFDNVKVRKAFALAVDRQALSDFRKTTKPLDGMTPSGIFPEYDKVRERVTPGASYSFDPEQARRVLTEAGFPVNTSGSGFSCPSFPTGSVDILFNPNENNKSTGEFVQAQWKQNLGVTIPLRNQEFKTFLAEKHNVAYGGFALSLWSGDFMDPYAFLSLHYGYPNNGDSGFKDPKYDKMLDEANAELDPEKRYEMLARAEAYINDLQPSVPLMTNATNWMKKPYVKGMYPNPGTLLPWKFVYIENDPAKWDSDVENLMTQHDERVERQLTELTKTQVPETEQKPAR